MYIKQLTIGNVKLENNIILAPMAGITDLPFRLIAKEHNPGLVCTEMVSSKALMYGDSKTKLLLNTKSEKRPVQMQIFGSDIESMGYAASYVSELADILDINMGCPAPKVVKNGDGSKLLLDLPKAEAIIKEVVKNSKVPVTLKIRKGWNQDNIVAIDIAKIAENCGISAITVHGRTREEFYSGEADWDIIKKVKQNVNIPVIGNGDVKSKKDVIRMFEQTGVDGIMIGRAVVGNPWIFDEILKQDYNGVSYKEKYDTIIKHLNLEVQEKGEKTGIREMRKHLSAYIKNMPNATRMREYINKIDNLLELQKCLKEYFNGLEICE